jgi:hypothetical protein
MKRKRLSLKNLLFVMMGLLFIVPEPFHAHAAVIITPSPADKAPGVSLDVKITATFSEDMDTLTVNKDTFFVTTGKLYGYETVAGKVEYNSNTKTATLTPSTPLEALMPYEVTITTDVKNLSGGNPLPEDYKWRFGTGTGTGNYATVVSATPANGAKDVHPAAVIIITFSKDMQESSFNSDTFFVTTGEKYEAATVAGNVSYSNKTATFTPSAKLAPNTLYNVSVTAEVKDSDGISLAGLYSWSFTTGTDIFSVSIDSPSSDKTVVEGETVNFQASIIGGKSPFTYSWAISGLDISENGDHEDLGDFKFNTEGLYTVTFTATDADNKTASDSVKITVTKDTTPTIVGPYPSDTATNIPLDTVIRVRFSTDMDEASINDKTFLMKKVGGYDTEIIAGTVTVADGNYAIFTTAESLEPDTSYDLTVTTGIKSRSGKTLQKDYEWSFTTGSKSIAPTVRWSEPSGNFVAVTDEGIYAGFLEHIEPSSINGNTFFVSDGSKKIAGTVSYSDVWGDGIFEPAEKLAYNTTYTATVTTGVKNRSGIAMKENYVWSFTTIGSEPPEVLSTMPANGATKVPVNALITAAFSKDMDESTLTGAFMVDNASHNPITGTVSYSNRVATFIPTAALEYGKTYTAFVTEDAKDSGGIPLQTEKSWSFTIAPQGCGIKGDINGDNKVTLADAVLALQICSGEDGFSVCKEADVDGDGKIGIAELIYILNFLATN